MSTTKRKAARAAGQPKPVTINGVRVQPRWQWSKTYAASYREGFRYPAKEPVTIAVKYARWLSARDGVDLGREPLGFRVEGNPVYGYLPGTDEKGRLVRRIRAVEFKVGTHERSEFYWSGGRMKPDPNYSMTTVETIEIPNWDASSDVIEEHQQPELIAA